LSPDVTGPPPNRPVLFGSVGQPRSVKVTGGGSAKVAFRNEGNRTRRLGERFEEAMADFGTQIALSQSLHATDPQLVLVFEALDEQTDLGKVADRLGFEILNESEGSMTPTDDFGFISDSPRDPEIKTCLHAVCLTQSAMTRLLGLWNEWTRTGRVERGYGPLKELFSHLKDVRPWGPADRLKAIDWDQYFAERLPDQLHTLEIELWYRKSPVLRQRAQSEVEGLVRAAGGTVLTSATIGAVGYHGIKCTVPEDFVQKLAQREFAQVQVVKSANVMYLRLSGQTVRIESPSTEAKTPDVPMPTGAPVVCLLDGVPAANHPLLSGRVIVHDPDDLSSDSENTVEDRKHGTWMASTVVWGDRGANEAPLNRPVLVRPILSPTADTVDRIEEIKANDLTPDLMQRIFRELYEDIDGQNAAAPEIVVINLSVGDPTTPFDSVLSSWARTLDWLSFRYGVLVVVSAGNYGELPLGPLNSDSIQELKGEDRRESILAAQHQDQANRRLLSPSEAINALTVGAMHDDASDLKPVGYVFDPSDGLPTVSPVSALGGGYRRSIKPEVTAPGGRVLFTSPVIPKGSLTIARATAKGPGIRVASSTIGQESFTTGTSPAAALVTRQASRLHDALDEIVNGVPLSRHERAVAIKALLAHGARHPEGFKSDSLPVEKAIGFGSINRDYSLGCSRNEAVILYLGSLGAAEEQDLLLPLPEGLNVRETKRITATLAWLSPVNWQHRQYRRAAMSFTKPTGTPKLDSPVDLSDDDAKRGSGTIKHLTWETEKAFATGQGSNVALKVKCLEQAGGLGGERIPYAVALSLWVAPTLNIDVYTQVRQQVMPQVTVRPGI
jgi:hypothetical protein